MEPTDIVRCGKDINIQKTLVIYDAGIDWAYERNGRQSSLLHKI